MTNNYFWASRGSRLKNEPCSSALYTLKHFSRLGKKLPPNLFCDFKKTRIYKMKFFDVARITATQLLLADWKKFHPRSTFYIAKCISSNKYAWLSIFVEEKPYKYVCESMKLYEEKERRWVRGRECLAWLYVEFVVLQTYLIPRSIAATTTLRRFYTDNWYQKYLAFKRKTMALRGFWNGCDY